MASSRQSGGQVRIYSEVGKGTTMCLYLPRHDGEAGAEDPTARSADGRRTPATARSCWSSTTSRPSGCWSPRCSKTWAMPRIEAADGPSGLRVLQSTARIDLLITDVGLPGGMNGRQMADAARETRPELKVLFITGYAENAVVGQRASRKGHAGCRQAVRDGRPCP